jgi:hypothetical protein
MRSHCAASNTSSRTGRRNRPARYLDSLGGYVGPSAQAIKRRCRRPALPPRPMLLAAAQGHAFRGANAGRESCRAAQEATPDGIESRHGRCTRAWRQCAAFPDNGASGFVTRKTSDGPTHVPIPAETGSFKRGRAVAVSNSCGSPLGSAIRVAADVFMLAGRSVADRT